MAWTYVIWISCVVRQCTFAMFSHKKRRKFVKQTIKAYVFWIRKLRTGKVHCQLNKQTGIKHVYFLSCCVTEWLRKSCHDYPINNFSLKYRLCLCDVFSLYIDVSTVSVSFVLFHPCLFSTFIVSWRPWKWLMVLSSIDWMRLCITLLRSRKQISHQLPFIDQTVSSIQFSYVCKISFLYLGHRSHSFEEYY